MTLPPSRRGRLSGSKRLAVCLLNETITKDVALISINVFADYIEPASGLSQIQFFSGIGSGAKVGAFGVDQKLEGERN